MPFQYDVDLAHRMQRPLHRSPDGPVIDDKRDKAMTFRFETAQRVAFSLVGAILFATIAVSAATPILPIV